MNKNKENSHALLGLLINIFKRMPTHQTTIKRHICQHICQQQW